MCCCGSDGVLEVARVGYVGDLRLWSTSCGTWRVGRMTADLSAFLSHSVEGVSVADDCSTAAWRQAVRHHLHGFLSGVSFTHGLHPGRSRHDEAPTLSWGDVGHIPCAGMLGATAEVQLPHANPGEELPQSGLGVGGPHQITVYAI